MLSEEELEEGVTWLRSGGEQKMLLLSRSVAKD